MYRRPPLLRKNRLLSRFFLREGGRLNTGYKRGRFRDRRRLKQRGVYSRTYNCKKHNILSAKISGELENSRISSLSIDTCTSRPPRDPQRFFKSQ